MGTLPKKPLSRAWLFPLVLILAASATQIALPAPALPPVEVEGQPLAANATRLAEALHFLGAPLPQETASALQEAARARDARKIQELLDPRVLLVVTVSPNDPFRSRSKTIDWPAPLGWSVPPNDPPT